LYASRTGNTEKVALRFKKVFENKGWVCDLFKVEKDADAQKMPDYKSYDFLCVGSPVHLKLAAEEMRTVLMPAPPKRAPGEERPCIVQFDRLIFSPDDKKGVVFATYSGLSYGPKEPEPVLS
jgi:hypothetical protein